MNYAKATKRALRPVSAWMFSCILALGATAAATGCGPGGEGSGPGGSAANGGDGSPGGNGAGGHGNNATGGKGGGGEANTGGSGATGTVLPSTCDASTPGARLLRRLTRRELLNSHTDVFGEAATSAAGLPGDSVDRIRLSNDASILSMGQDAALALLERAEDIAAAVTEPSALSNHLPCSSTSQDEACATEFIQKYGESLYRRPLADSDVARYAGLYRSIAATSDFGTALKWVLVGLIQSPHAVYRSELGQDGKLLPHEVASELAYSFSASPPSAELFAKALSGELDDPEARYQEAQKLLLTPRGKEVIRQFFEEWLSYRDVLTVARADETSSFERVRPKMVLETERFLDTLLFEKSGNLTDLLTADFTVADQDLAAYYGFAGGSGDMLSGGGNEVKRDWGLGVFAQGSVTATMASIAITSPTRRGLLLLRRLYCEVPGLPQGINFDLTSSEVEGNTTRERLENSHLDGGCQSCHKLFDPLGFGFEHIDHLGRYRTEEATERGSFPVDATATVATLGGLMIDGQEQLMRGLAEDPTVLACVSQTMTRYVYGSSGTCRAPEAQERAMKGETSIVEFLADLARAPHFISR